MNMRALLIRVYMRAFWQTCIATPGTALLSAGFAVDLLFAGKPRDEAGGPKLCLVLP